MLTTGLPESSVRGPLFFFIYIMYFPPGLTTDVKLFADDTSLFSVVESASVSGSRLNSDLMKIRDWALNWKIYFNPDPTKQSKEVVLLKKILVLMSLSYLIL